MTNASLEHGKQYTFLQDAAHAIGLVHESELIERRMEDLNDAFMLYVIGLESSGKSTAINLLAGTPIAPVNASHPWVNVYQAATGSSSQAEIRYRDADRAAEVMPISAARNRCRALAGSAQGGVVREVIWRVTGTSIPEGVKIVEIPSVEKPGSKWLEYYRRADGVLWVMRADKLTARARLQAHLLSNLEPKSSMPLIGVLTHMEKVQEDRRDEVLKLVKNQLVPSLEHLVPIVGTAGGGQTVQRGSIHPLVRLVRNHLFAIAAEARLESHAAFQRGMQRTLAEKYESYLDDKLYRRAAYLRWKQSLQDTLDRTVSDAQPHMDALVEKFRMRGMKVLQQGGSTELVRSAHAIDSITSFLRAFFSKIVTDMVRTADACPAPESCYGEGEAPSSRTLMPDRFAVSVSSSDSRFPHPPIEALIAFEEGPPPDTDAAVPARAYHHDATANFAADSIGVQAAIWKPGEAWLAHYTDHVGGIMGVWLQNVRAIVESEQLQAAFKHFGAKHGFDPENPLPFLRAVETKYERLTGTSTHVAVPGGVASEESSLGRVSPVSFLCNFQEPGFADTWNDALFREFQQRQIPELHRHLRSRLQDRTERVLEEWNRDRAHFYARVRNVWKEKASVFSLHEDVEWSMHWAVEDWEQSRKKPIHQILLDRRVGKTPKEELPWLIDSASLLGTRSHDAPEELSLSEHLAHRTWQMLTEEIQNAWSRDAVVRLKVSAKGLAGTWAGLFGGSGILCLSAWNAFAQGGYGLPVGIVALGHLAVLATLIAAGIWRLRRAAQHENEADRHAEALHRAVRRYIRAQMESTGRKLHRELNRSDVLQELRTIVRERQHLPAEHVAPFSTFSRRLRLTSSAPESHIKTAGHYVS